jgi:ribonuclease HI
LIRGENKEWLGGFSKFIGLCSAFVAELWGVFEGLELAQIKGFGKVEICVDSQAVISGIRKGDCSNAMGFKLVQRIRQMLKLNWVVSIIYCSSSEIGYIIRLKQLGQSDLTEAPMLK